MRRIISTSAVLLALAGLTFVVVWPGDSIVSAEPADNQVAPQPAPADVDEEPLAQGPADQAPQVDEAQLQAEQQAREAELRPADQAPQVDEAANAVQRSQVEQLEALPQATPRAPIFDGNTSRLSFQAVLTDNMGNALPGPTVDLRFQVYTSPGGVAVGAPITVCAVPIVNGVVDTQVPVPATSIDGTGRQMGVSIDTTGACAAFGPELTPRTELTAVPHAFRVNRVASAELDDFIDLGDATSLGTLQVHNGTGAVSIVLDGNGFSGGGIVFLRNSAGSEKARLAGDDGGAGILILRQNDGSFGVLVDGDNGIDGGGSITVRDSVSSTRVQILGESTGTGGEVSVFDDNGTETVEILGAASTLDGGHVLVRNNSGVNTLLLDGDSADAGLISIRNTAGTEKVFMDGDSAGAGLITLDQNDFSVGITLDGDAGTNVGGVIRVHDSVSSTRVQLLGQSVGTGGEISVFDDNGTETVEILGAESTTTGAQINLMKADGTVTISIDADFNNDGRIVTQELQITGGSDLSEQFDVQAVANGKVEPGMVVCIDAKRPGKLLVSAKANDRTVAGIISGAGGVETGMYMGQRGSEEADGQYPVALTGRVYVWCDASQGAVEPGDMLTTSNTPGHAMKVADHAKAQGAIIGKAMSSLKSGRGLVLVLVSLQ